MSRYLPITIIAVVAVLALVGGTLLYRVMRMPIVQSPMAHEGVDDTEAVHVRGPRDATVTLEEFGDFECFACSRLAHVLDQLERDYRPRLRIVFRHLPLNSHPHAREAALASEAAGLQGRFWEMHDLLYQEQKAWSESRDARSL